MLQITVLERSDVLPAVDGSSNDFNRIVRSSYSDKFYAQLALDAIKTWKTELYKDAYHELVSLERFMYLADKRTDAVSSSWAQTATPNTRMPL